ncbi:exported protein of unknown function [Hyphomicrobium sp. 1Nfss2.1]|uniref:DUF3280 domain-containing protein n=1 Tax=Hyphomicrobium sp. 1Nfss2.1 TaxID=3413936 RepID=UPI003C79B687
MLNLRSLIGSIAVALLAVAAVYGVPTAKANVPPALTYLGAFLQNDNAGLEPTTDAERARLRQIGKTFIRELGESGQFRLVPLSSGQMERIAAGQTPGECGQCEIEYGRSAGADIVAWLTVQKVSNLILNMNAYMVDVASGRRLLVKSVDLRGNTDESWSRGVNYLVKNLVLPARVAVPPA